MALPTYPWPEYQHELGGAKIYYLSKKQWEEEIKEDYLEHVAHGSFFKPNPPEELIKKNEKIIIPEEIEV